ncbi:hypothetical protein GCM10011282_22320 [Undibacterium macrobrachii]|uniref:Uncharacterized protein n=1 Tax=Undibacterium macrobrachii TaxID=1119058 RepID=A0ABQ2XH07_9BURK|nr:hypothetical protein GCM10011282_22320 [Undibacterium macrobrachii]
MPAPFTLAPTSVGAPMSEMVFIIEHSLSKELIRVCGAVCALAVCTQALHVRRRQTRFIDGVD